MNYMNTPELLHQLFTERNSSKSTQENYKRAVKYFEKHTQKTLPEIMKIAEEEEKNPTLSWKDSYLRKQIITFRTYLYENYKKNTATTYFNKILAIFRHFGITIYQLPYFSTKHLPETQIFPEDLPDRELIRKCIEIKNPLLKAAILLMSSSGISRIDLLELTIEDYLKATSDYHSSFNIYDAIEEMKDKDVIPTFQLHRRKTGVPFITFCSPEAVEAINNYLLSRNDKLTNDSKLFKVHPRHFSLLFYRLNEKLNLGTAGSYSRFSPHALRRYHATQLAESGMNDSHIDLLQGRKPKGVIHHSYVRIKKEVLKDEYIHALPFIVISKETTFKTELEQVKEEKDELVKVNKELSSRVSEIEDIKKRILALESDKPTWNEYIQGD